MISPSAVVYSGRFSSRVLSARARMVAEDALLLARADVETSQGRVGTGNASELGTCGAVGNPRRSCEVGVGVLFHICNDQRAAVVALDGGCGEGVLGFRSRSVGALDRPRRDDRDDHKMTSHRVSLRAIGCAIALGRAAG